MYLCLYKFCILRAKECTIIVSPFLYNLCLLWLLIASIKFFAVFVFFEMSLLFVTWTFRTWAWLCSWWPHSRLDLWVQKNSSFFSEISQGQLLSQGTLGSFYWENKTLLAFESWRGKFAWLQNLDVKRTDETLN